MADGEEARTRQEADAPGPGLVKSLVSSAGLLISRVGGVAVTLAYTLLIARLMDPAQVGIASTLTSSMTFAAFLATLNFGSGALRYLVQALAVDDRPRAKGFLTVGKWLVIVGGPLAGIIHYFLLRATKPSFPAEAVLLASLAVPVLASLLYLSRTVSQMGSPTRSQLANLFIRPLALLGLTLAASIFLKLDVSLLALAMLYACVIAFLVQRSLLARGKGLPRIEGPASFNGVGAWISGGLMLSPRLIIEQYLPDFVIMASSAALSHAEVGFLMVALRCSNMIRFAAVSVEMATTPRLARAEALKNYAQRDKILRMAMHMRFWPVVAVSILTFAFAPLILSIFGPRYVAGAWALRVSLITPVALAFFGPSHVLLVVRGHIKTVCAIASVALGGLFVAIPFAAHAWGLAGVSGATSLVMVCMFLAFYLALRLMTGIDASVLGAITGKPGSRAPTAGA